MGRYAEASFREKMTMDQSEGHTQEDAPREKRLHKERRDSAGKNPDIILPKLNLLSLASQLRTDKSSTYQVVAANFPSRP